MSKTFSFSFDSKTFDQAIAEISHITGKSQSDVIKNEARAILGQSMKNTGVADKKLIRARHNYKGDGNDAPGVVKVFERVNGKKVRVRSIKRKGMWGTTPKGKVAYYANRINPLFKELTTVLKSRMNDALANAGQSKATFIFLAQSLRLRDPSSEEKRFGGVTIPAYVTKALSIFPRSLKERLKTRDSGEDNYTITISHKGISALSPASRKGAGGIKAFALAYSGRIKFYKQNIEKGVFKTAKKVLAKYPGLKVEQD